LSRCCQYANVPLPLNSAAVKRDDTIDDDELGSVLFYRFAKGLYYYFEVARIVNLTDVYLP
jgi:hypothetical protein